MDPYMWAVGVRFGTIAIPGHYPALLPDSVRQYDFVETGPLAGDPSSDEPDRDLHPDTLEPRFTSLERVGPDLRLGLDAFYGLDDTHRLYLGGGTAFGERYDDGWFTFGYGHVLVAETSFDLVTRFDTGFGSMKLTGTDDDETLRVPYFPIRASLAAELLNGTQLYGLGLLLGTNIPSRHDYTDLDGAEQTVKGAFSFGRYFFLGFELEVMFGDLRA